LTPASQGEWVGGTGLSLLPGLADVNPISEVVVSRGVERTLASICASRFCSSLSPARIAASSAFKSECELSVAVADDWLPDPPDTRLAILSAINRACSRSVLIMFSLLVFQ